MHPVIRAIILHFRVVYDHPFVDGNGRTARTPFCWSMLSQGCRRAQFLSISSILAQAPARYANSCLHTETDGNDLTCFSGYKLGVIGRSIRTLRKYFERKAGEVRDVAPLIRGAGSFFRRQSALLGHGRWHSGARHTIESHEVSIGSPAGPHGPTCRPRE